jgi:hypothetical protein
LAAEAAAAKNPKKPKRTKMAAAATSCSYLPEELWERIVKFLNDEGDYNHYSNIDDYGMLGFNRHHGSLRFLSVVSKQFLSITNRFRSSVTISDQTIPFLHRLFYRFPNVTSLSITLLSQDRLREGDLSELLEKISTFPLDLISLTLYHPITLPTEGLQVLSQKMKNLTYLTCYQMKYIHKNDLFFIADCFPLLEELILTDTIYTNDLVMIDIDFQFLALPKLRKIALSCNFIGHHSIIDFCKNCHHLQEVKLIDYPRYTRAIGGRPLYPLLGRRLYNRRRRTSRCCRLVL